MGMKSKTKIVEIDGARYQVRKMAPDVGSFILMRLIAAGISGGGDAQSAPSGEAAASDSPAMGKGELSGEELVRAVAFTAFLKGLDYQTHAFLQRACLAVCSRMEEKEGADLPMPIASDTGVWAIPEVRDDVSLVMRLEVEALVWNLADFFEQGGLKALAGEAAQ